MFFLSLDVEGFYFGIGKDWYYGKCKILEQKSLVVDEIKGKFENAKSVVVFDPRGLNVAEVTELRRALRESGSDYKVYKNTLVKRAVNSLDIKLDEFLEGPSAISFSSDELAPVKVISEFAKNILILN